MDIASPNPSFPFPNIPYSILFFIYLIFFPQWGRGRLGNLITLVKMF
jgi:hypothetical protein